MHSYSYGRLPTSFDGLWLPNKYYNPALAGLRKADELYIPQPRIQFCGRLPLHSFPKLWNEFEDKKIKNMQRSNPFKEGLKNYFLNDLAETVHCGRAFCRNCFPE